MRGHHAPLWYLLYAPTEWWTDFYAYKIKRWLKSKRASPKPDEEENVFGKVVVITGANSGLGKHTAIALAKRGAIVVMGCRNMDKGQEARKEIIEKSSSTTVELYELDLSDLDSVRRFSAQVLNNHAVVDILINNGGVNHNSSKQQLSKEGWDLCMTTNYLGHFLLTNLLIPVIIPSSIARVVTLSSSTCIPSTLDPNDLMMQNVRTLGFWNSKPYSNSKMANAFLSKSLAKRFPSIKSYALCPGLVKTEIFQHYERKRITILMGHVLRFFYEQKVEMGVEHVLLCALSKKVEGDSGGYFRFGKRLKQVEKMMKDEVADAIWSASEKIVCQQDK